MTVNALPLRQPLSTTPTARPIDPQTVSGWFCCTGVESSPELFFGSQMETARVWPTRLCTSTLSDGKCTEIGVWLCALALLACVCVCVCVCVHDQKYLFARPCTAVLCGVCMRVVSVGVRARHGSMGSVLTLCV